MKVENLILNKSYEFAIKIVSLYRFLCENKREFVLSKQLLRSGTSIGANLEEAQAGQSKKDFISKVSIANKEARETKYWLKLLNDTGFLDDFDGREELLDELNSIVSILTKIVKTAQKRLNKCK